LRTSDGYLGLNGLAVLIASAVLWDLATSWSTLAFLGWNAGILLAASAIALRLQRGTASTVKPEPPADQAAQ
jgi:hypothetical protein